MQYALVASCAQMQFNNAAYGVKMVAHNTSTWRATSKKPYSMLNALSFCGLLSQRAICTILFLFIIQRVKIIARTFLTSAILLLLWLFIV